MGMDGDRWLSAKAAERRARTSYRYRTDAVTLREAWHAEVQEIGYASPGDWWTPAVDALTRAIVQGRAPEPPAAQLGRERAAAGWTVEQALADLRVLYRLLPSGTPPPDVATALVEAAGSAGTST
ncbi:hypothetical protein K1W54_41485 [Micromonospora sp. CPCC 205371]|nr:hypothetical protein [Micromonospora sp. CPCC 205371]